MILILATTLTLLVSYVLYWRCDVEERALRWKLYQLRDDLRNMAYENPVLLDSEVFTTLDSRLTTLCAHLRDLSIWTLVPVVVMADREKIEGRQRDFVAKLHQPKNSVMVDTYFASAILLVQHLRWRHPLLTVLAFVTLHLFEKSRWLSERCQHAGCKKLVVHRSRSRWPIKTSSHL